MKLILSGGGSGEKTAELDRLFASLLDKKKPLLYIPIAIDSIKHPYPECLNWLKSTFEALEIKKYEMITEKEIIKQKKIDINKYSGIYIGGGNTLYLLKKLKTSQLWVLIKEAIKKDIPTYGGSAGAIIFSKSAITSTYFDKNWVELKDLEGMNIIKNNHLFCHYTPKEELKIKNIISTEKILPAIALPERTGLYITDKEIKVIGQESAWMFDNKGNIKELKVGKTF